MSLLYKLNALLLPTNQHRILEILEDGVNGRAEDDFEDRLIAIAAHHEIAVSTQSGGSFKNSKNNRTC